MPVIATQTEPMWDVVDKLNEEFDIVQGKNIKLEDELLGFYLEKHKQNNETVGQLELLFESMNEVAYEHWEDEYKFWGEYPIHNVVRNFLYGSYDQAHAELNADLDLYFGRNIWETTASFEATAASIARKMDIRRSRLAAKMELLRVKCLELGIE